VFFHQDLGEALEGLVGLALVPQEQVLQPPALQLQVELHGDQLQVRLAAALWSRGLGEECAVELGLVVGRLEEGELRDVD